MFRERRRAKPNFAKICAFDSTLAQQLRGDADGDFSWVIATAEIAGDVAFVGEDYLGADLARHVDADGDDDQIATLTPHRVDLVKQLGDLRAF